MKPTVLVVDDEIENARGLAQELGDSVQLVPSDPGDLEAEDLAGADLVLVDYDLHEWTEGDATPTIANRPRQGLALAGVLRSHTDVISGDRPVAFALYSGKIGSIAGSLPEEVRDHVLARLNNLEWVFEKGALGLGAKIASLASAVAELRSAGASEHAGDRVRRLLAIPEVEWQAEAWRSVEACHPPLHELSEATHSLALLRWLAQRILPYPCFLWDETYLAVALGIAPASLAEVLAGESPLKQSLDGVRYSGILAAFLGPRWWRTGVENVMWEVTGGAADSDRVHAALSDSAGTEIIRLPPRAVVPLGRDYQPAGEPVGVEDALRIQPDDWPPFADDAWTTVELARADPALRALVVDLDRELLDSEA